MANKRNISVLSGIEITDRVVKYCIQTQVVVKLNGPIFWETESICQVNRFELRIGMHYCLVHYFCMQLYALNT